MLSKKSFWGAKQFFLEALVRRYEEDVGGHIIIRISNRQPSLGLYAELEYRRPVSTCAQGKNSVCSFWTFSTASTRFGHEPSLSLLCTGSVWRTQVHLCFFSFFTRCF